ncbi:MAG TPA: hypothetical protein VK444_01660 [Methanobacteriaceae archaeon]|nr:hypothetical protein [Methanobacteriaceae archaeon]
MGKFEWLLMTIMLILIALTYFNGVEISNTNLTSFSDIISPNMEVLGTTENGYVIREGPFGNQSSPAKIAYIVGIHPLEFKSHRAIKEALMDRKDSLKYCYYIYEVQVTQNRGNYNLGRLHGQQLAKEYVVPDIQINGFKLAVDVHSNQGNYALQRFIAVPVRENRSDDLAGQIVNKIPWLKIYAPPPEKGPTSGPYVSIPIITSGTPTIVYETYQNDSYGIILHQAFEFSEIVDQIRLI